MDTHVLLVKRPFSNLTIASLKLDLLKSLSLKKGKKEKMKGKERDSRSLPFFPFSLSLKRETCSKSTL